jgi:hypothetical protein
MKAYKGSKWAIVKEEWWIDGAACEHALCEKFHSKNGCPEVRRVEWLILNIETNNRLGMGEAYALRRDAVKELEWHLAKEAK